MVFKLNWSALGGGGAQYLNTEIILLHTPHAPNIHHDNFLRVYCPESVKRNVA